MESITDTDYVHAKRVFKDFEIKHLGEHQDLHVQSNILLLADVFENFRNIHIQSEYRKIQTRNNSVFGHFSRSVYELNPARFVTSPGLAWYSALKKTKVKLDLLTDFNMLLTIKKRYQRRNISCYLSIC